MLAARTLATRLAKLRPRVATALKRVAREARHPEVAFVLFEVCDGVWTTTSIPVSVWAHASTGATLDDRCHAGAFLLSGPSEPPPIIPFEEEDQLSAATLKNLVRGLTKMLIEIWQEIPSSKKIAAYVGSYDDPQWVDMHSGERVPRRPAQPMPASARDEAVEMAYRIRLREALQPFHAELQDDVLAEVRKRVREVGPSRVRVVVFGEGVFDAEPASVFFYDDCDEEMAEHTYVVELSQGLDDDLYEDLLQQDPNLHAYEVAGEEVVSVIRQLLVEAPLGPMLVEATVHDSGHVEVVSGGSVVEA